MNLKGWEMFGLDAMQQAALQAIINYIETAWTQGNPNFPDIPQWMFQPFDKYQAEDILAALSYSWTTGTAPPGDFLLRGWQDGPAAALAIAVPQGLTGVGGEGELPTATHYVSQSATNGYAIGVNSGAGTTKTSPWLTLEFALANAPTGSVIELNAGTYQAATFFNVLDKSLTIQASAPGTVTLSSADAQTRVINLALVSTSRTVTLNNLTLDGRNNTTRGISLGSSAIALGVVAGLSIRNCIIKDCTARYIEAPAQKSVDINVANLTITGTINGRPIFIQDAQDGAVHIKGVQINCTNALAGSAAIEINRAAGSTGIAVSVSEVVGTLTSATPVLMNGIVVRNVDNAIIQGCKLTVVGTSTSALYKVFSDSATLSANGAVVRGNSGHNAGDGGYCVLIGSDGASVGDNNHNNSLVENNNITANAAASTPIHGYMLGFGTGGAILNNTMTGAGHGVVVKCQTGGLVSGNAVSGFTSDGLYIKGATNVLLESNTVNVTIPNDFGTIRIGQDDITLAHSTGCEVSRNVLNVNINPPRVVTVSAGSDAVFTSNTYNITAPLGTSPAPWGYQGTGYNTLYAWKIAIEPTALP